MIHSDILRAHRIPLCVDLDHTLVRCDLLHEGMLQVAKARPLRMFAMVATLTRGRLALKDYIARHAAFDPAALPYRTDLVDHIARERAAGRPIHLVTASPQPWAEAVAQHLGLFDAVQASGSVNLKGADKAALLAGLHPDGYDYVGDARVDRPVWRQARHALRAGRGTCIALDDSRISAGDFPDTSRFATSLARAMRPHQWLKNLLVVAPLVAAHRVTEPVTLLAALLAMVGFSLLASATYLLNDMLDIAADRAHPRKCRRPFAAGDLSVTQGLAAFVVLLVGAALTTMALSPGFAVVLGGYTLLTVTYSFYWKRVALADLFVLATLYSMRIIAGGVATGVPLSPWMLGFSMFVFLALAAIKRCAELGDRRVAGNTPVAGRGYRRDDLPLIRTIASSSSFAAVIIFALYVTQADVRGLYSNPALLWLIAPLLLYWLGRMLLLTHRGAMHDDPVIFTMRDPNSLLLFAACAMVMLAASHTTMPPGLILTL